MLKVKAKLSFHNLAPMLGIGLDETNSTKGIRDNNIVIIINWIVNALKHILEKIDEQGDIITLHTEALADPNAAIFDPKDDVIKNLKQQIDTDS